MTSVLIVDDQPLQRMGFRMLLDSSPQITVVGEAENGERAVSLAADLQPDVVLMDVRMPGMDGIEATRRIVATGRHTHVLILTTFDFDEYAYSALRAGASGFLLKDAMPEDLLAGIRAVAAGDAVVAPAMTRRLIETFAPHLPTAGNPPSDDSRQLPPLTERERQVLTAVAGGLTNKEIAGRLTLSESTVKNHVSRLLDKIKARDRVQAVILAYDAGLVRPQR